MRSSPRETPVVQNYKHAKPPRLPITLLQVWPVCVYLHGPAPWKTVPCAAFRGRQELDLPEIYTPVRSNPGETPVGHQATCTKHKFGTHDGRHRRRRRQQTLDAEPTPGSPPHPTHTPTRAQGRHIIRSGGTPHPPLTPITQTCSVRASSEEARE